MSCRGADLAGKVVKERGGQKHPIPSEQASHILLYSLNGQILGHILILLTYCGPMRTVKIPIFTLSCCSEFNLIELDMVNT
ncbi:hypothetical protein U1Q18_047445 [Sarracenia purpurea var. burkii]